MFADDAWSLQWWYLIPSKYL